MDRQQKLEYQQKIEQYLTKQNVYDLFEDLTKALIVKQPDDPISFLIEKLSTPEGIDI
jgi:adenylate kinase